MRKSKLLIGLLLALFLVISIVDSRHAWEWTYTHWLYDYHFGFMKRGFVGQLLALAYGENQVVPLGTVKLISWLLFAANTVIFLVLFNQIRTTLSTEGQRRSYFAFFAFCLIAPTFLRNFSYDLGRFDQISSLVLLLQWFHPALWLTTFLSVVMVLIHENFLFIFLPAILLLVYLQKGFRSTLILGFCSLVATLIVMKFGGADTDIDTMWAYLLSKSDSLLDHNVELLYWNFSEQIEVNKAIRLRHIPFIPGFIFYFLWCLPFAIWWKKAKLKTPSLSPLYFFGIGLGYLIIFVLSDWCRSTANLFLTLVFLTLYFMKVDQEFRDRFISLPVFKSKKLIAVIVLSLFIPATGVDIPRIYKLYEKASQVFASKAKS